MTEPLVQDSTDDPDVEDYEFDADDVDIAIEMVDEAFSGSADHWDTVHRLDAAGRARGFDGSPLVLELIHAAGHGLVREPGGKAGCGLGRDREFKLLGWPRPIAEAPDASRELWRALADGASEPAAIARFEELLFARRDGNGRQRVQRAVASYLALVDATDVHPARIDMEAINLLLRSWTIARSVGDEDLDDDIRSRMAGIATHALALNPVAPPGVTLPLLHALAAGRLRNGTDLHDVDSLLEQAAAKYERGYLAAQIAADRRSRAGGNVEALARISRDEVAAFLAEADAAAEPAVRMHHLEAASLRARQLGLNDLAREAAAQMQKIRPSELGMQSVTLPLGVPSWIPSATCSRSPAAPPGTTASTTSSPPTTRRPDTSTTCEPPAMSHGASSPTCSPQRSSVAGSHASRPRPLQTEKHTA